MHVDAARPSLECTNKTCSDHAHFILHTALACHVFFCRPHTQLPLLTYTMAKVSSVGTRENSQPAQKMSFEFPIPR